MTRKIVVILFVICLDIAFILMIRGDFQPMLTSDVAKLEIANSVAPLHHTSLEPILLQEEAQPPVAHEVIDNESPGEFSIRASKARQGNAPPRFSRNEARRRTKRPASSTYAASKPFNGFTGTVIFYRNASYEARPRADHTLAPVNNCDPVSTPARRRRSIIKKSIPILKKPYDWVKELVSE